MVFNLLIAWQALMYVLTNQKHFRLSCLLCMHHESQRLTAVIQANSPVSSASVMVSENVCSVCFEHFHTECRKCFATVRCFLKLLTKSFPMFCVKNLSFLCNYCMLGLRIAVIQDSEDGRRSIEKKNALGKYWIGTECSRSYWRH